MPHSGPLPRFTEIHAQMALKLIEKYGRIGRKRLVEKLGVGEGSMRTILEKLCKQGLITSSRGGHSLTGKGKKFLYTLPNFVQVDAGDLTVGKFDVATVVSGASGKVKNGVEQRDEAMKAGADGATILIFRRGKLQFPGESMKVQEKLSRRLVAALRPRNGDVVIIGTGKDAAKAEAGARAAAQTLTTIRA